MTKNCLEPRLFLRQYARGRTIKLRVFHSDICVTLRISVAMRYFKKNLGVITMLITAGMSVWGQPETPSMMLYAVHYRLPTCVNVTQTFWCCVMGADRSGQRLPAIWRVVRKEDFSNMDMPPAPGVDPPSATNVETFSTVFRTPGEYSVWANIGGIGAGAGVIAEADLVKALSCNGIRSLKTAYVGVGSPGTTISVSADNPCPVCGKDPQWHTDGSLPIVPHPENKFIAELPISKVSDGSGGTPVTVEYNGSSKTLNVVIVGISSLEPDAGTWVDDHDGNPDTQTWVLEKADSGVVTIEAFPAPAIEVTRDVARMIGWRWAGVATNRVSRETGRTDVGMKIFSCQCGASAKTTTLKIINVEFRTNQVSSLWSRGGGYFPAANLTNSFDTNRLTWALNCIEGASDATIDSMNGRIIYGSGGGIYTIRATSKDAPAEFAEMNLCVAQVKFQAIAGVYEGGTHTITVTVPPQLSGTNIILKLITATGNGSAMFANGFPKTQIVGNATMTLTGVLASSVATNIRLVAEIGVQETVRLQGRIAKISPLTNEIRWKEAGAMSFTVLKLDLDVDSNNDDGFAPPKRDAEEELIEDLAGETNFPGRLIWANDNDKDSDGIPDFADGFNGDRQAGNEDDINIKEQYIPLVLELPLALDLKKAKLTMAYEASDPASVTNHGIPPVWASAPGPLRIWTKDGNQPRCKNSVLDAGNPGDYVPPGTYDDLSRLGFSNAVRSVLLYVEGISSSKTLADQQIKVTLESGEESAGLIGADAVRLTVVKAGLVADFNHDRKIDTNDIDTAKTGVPFRFWINDDDDIGDISGNESDIPGALTGVWELDGRTPDYVNNQVDGRSDLLDFFPLWIDLKQSLDVFPPGKDIEYRMQQDDNAVKVVYTDLTKGQAGAFLTTESIDFGASFNKPAGQADAVVIPTSGVALSETFLNNIRYGDGKGVLLVEGVKPTTKPIVLEIRKSGRTVYEKKMPLSIAEVEKMYRWVNLRGVAGGAVRRQTNPNIPANYPDSLCNGKQFVFVHGYSVDERHARGWNAEMFKRLYQSGSRAMFTAVTWRGDDSQIKDGVPFLGGLTLNYYINVIHAFETASSLVAAMNNLPGQKYVAGHSMGNMLVSSAIIDHGLNVNAYYMLNAAVAMEAYKGTIVSRFSMRNPAWGKFPHQLWASEWYQLFDIGDGRRNLTWRNRFGNIPRAFNYYSSGEDVLANGTGVLPLEMDECAWVSQEMLKGTLLIKVGPGRSHGGWGFNNASIGGYGTNIQEDIGGYEWKSLNPAQAALLTPAQIRTNSFFKLFANRELYGVNGSAVAQDWRVRAQILAEAIPALSFAAGRNNIYGFGIDRVNMNTKKNSWPTQRLIIQKLRDRWLHSDLKNIAYQYVYPLFDDISRKGDL